MIEHQVGRLQIRLPAAVSASPQPCPADAPVLCGARGEAAAAAVLARVEHDAAHAQARQLQRTAQAGQAAPDDGDGGVAAEGLLPAHLLGDIDLAPAQKGRSPQ